MPDSNTNSTSAPGAPRARRTDGFTDLFGVSPFTPMTPPPISGDNRLYSNMTRYWRGNYANTDYYTMYINNGIAGTIIDKPADDCFARGFVVVGDDDDLLQDELDRLSVNSTYSDAVRWARLFGAAVILMVVKDGGALDTPLNLDSVDTVEDLVVYDNRHIKPTDQLYTDPQNVMYGKPELFRIHPPGGDEFLCHETRLIPFSGEPLPKSTAKSTNVWWLGKSALDYCATDIARLERAYEWTERLLERKQQGIYRMEGLGEMFAAEQDHIVSKRIAMVDHVRSTLSSVVVDMHDEYTVLNLGLDNVQSVLMEFEIAVCASTQMPSVILFGKSATTLNATGAGELEIYYSLVGRLQHRVVKPALERLISVLWLQKSLKSKIPDKWYIEFNPLWVPPDKEVAEVKQLEASAMSAEVTMLLTLLDAGILMPEEVRKIIINRYEEFEFDENADLSLGGDEDYSASVGGNEEDDTSDDPLAESNDDD